MKRCWPTGRPSSCSLEGSEKRKTRVSCEISVRLSSGSLMNLPLMRAIGEEALTSMPTSGSLGTGGGAGRTIGGAAVEPLGPFFAFSSSNQPPKLPGPASVGCWNLRAGMPVASSATRCTLIRKYELFIMPITFQVRFSGWRFIAESQPRTRISAVSHVQRSESGTSSSQKHQHQYRPYSVGSSGWLSFDSVHVLPPSMETSTRITLRPPPE
mmetsp:Transcript_82534/g.164574  ORF Transcript_82534/g.164574 Transcript_82534/m.164574 type:complete len:212 (+) Transcript_82534:1123-1758(+)